MSKKKFISADILTIPAQEFRELIPLVSCSGGSGGTLCGTGVDYDGIKCPSSVNYCSVGANYHGASGTCTSINEYIGAMKLEEAAL
jgi:hypothetical protein